MPKTTELSKITAGEFELARKSLLDEVRVAAQKRKITQEQIAERTGLHRSNISRIFSGRYSPELDTFLKIAAAVGLRLRILKT